MMDSLLLYKILKNRTGAEISASGNPATLPGTLKNNPMNGMKVFGWSKQEHTTGAQLFDASRFDGIEQHGVSLTVEDGVIYAEGTPTQNAWITAKLTADEIKKVFKNGKLTIKSEKVNNCNFTVGLYFEFIPTSFAADGSSIELTLPENIADGCIYYYVNLIKDTEMIGGRKIMLYQDGNGTWEPYTGGQPSPNPDYPQQIVSAGSDGKINLEVHGKNLFNITTESKCDKSGASSTKRIILPGEYILGLAYTNICANYLNNVFISQERISFFSDGVGYGIGIGVIAEKGKKYVISGEYKNGDTRMVFYDKSGGIMWNTDDNPFVVPEGTKYAVLLLRKSKNTTDEVVFKNIQVEEAISPTGYESYHTPQSLSIQTPTGLQAIPVTSGGNYTDASGQQWIADYIDLKRGKYVQNVRTITIDEKTRLWHQKGLTTPTVEEGYYTVTCGADRILGKELLVDKFRCSKAYWTNEIRYCQKEVYAFARLNDNSIVFVLPEERFANKAEFAEYLAEHPLTVMTYLDHPIERNLTQEEIQACKALKTYNGTTIVENDAECYMEVSAGGGDSLRAKKLALILGE